MSAPWTSPQRCSNLPCCDPNSSSFAITSFTIFTANPEVNMMAACWLHAWDAAAKASMRAGISQLHQQVQMQGGIWLQR